MQLRRTWRTLPGSTSSNLLILMKKIFLLAALSLPVLSLVVVLSAGGFLETAGQNLPQRERTVVPTAISKPIKPVKTAISEAFNRAAAANAASVGTLKWPFGGKMQNGWGIYVELIAQTIG